MIEKILIAEDHESSNLSVERAVEDLKIKQCDTVFHCDDALQKIQLAKQQGTPYDVLITDLYFEDDGSARNISSGFDLVSAVRAIQPALMVLVFSGEDRPAVIEKLFKDYAIDGYVRKARFDIKELKTALQSLSEHRQHIPSALASFRKTGNAYSFTDLDVDIIRMISEGRALKEMPAMLDAKGVKPSSLSMIEKRLKNIRDTLGFSKNEQVVLFCKEAGIL